MSAPLRGTLNDREVPPPRSARSRPQLHLLTQPVLGPGPHSAMRSPCQPEPVSASPLSAGFHPDGSRAPRPLPKARSKRSAFRNLLPGNWTARSGSRDQPMEIDDDDDGGGTRGGGPQGAGLQGRGAPVHGRQIQGSQAHGSHVYGPQTYGSQGLGPRRPQAQDPHISGPQGGGPQVHNSQIYGPQAHGSQTYGPEVYGHQGYGQQGFTSQRNGPQNGPQAPGSQVRGPQKNDLQGRGPQVHASQSHGSQQRGLQVNGHQGYGPQGFSSQFYGPQHGSWVDDPQLYGPQGYNPQNNGPQHGPNLHGSQVHGPQGYNPQSSGPLLLQVPAHPIDPSSSNLAKRRRREATVYQPAPSHSHTDPASSITLQRSPAVGLSPHNHTFPPVRTIPGQSYLNKTRHGLPLIHRFPGIFNALLNHPELIINFASHLPLPTLTALYAISRTFHYTVDQRFTALMRAHADLHAPESRIAFPHHCYPRLCRPDPAARVNENNPREVRATPTLRWLGMVLFRERVVEEILALLQKEGLNMPGKTSSTIKKIWFVMDMGVNALRVGILRNPAVWSDDDLYRATEFFLKLAMRFTDPRSGSGTHALRKLLLAQKSLSTLWRVLKREELTTQLEVLRMDVRTFYVPPRLAHLPILGVPPNRIGRLQWEGYGKVPGTKLLQIDELVMKESIRRELRLQTWYLDMVMSGFVDKTKGQEFKDIWGQDEVELEDCEVNSDGEETASDTEWETEEEYFQEESSEEEEGGSSDALDDDDEMWDEEADDEKENRGGRHERVMRRRRPMIKVEDEDEDMAGPKLGGGLPGNFAF